MEELKLKLKCEIKQEILTYYDNLGSDIDAKAQALSNDKSLNEERENFTFEENIYLTEQIKRICDSNLKDINDFFDKSNQNDEIFKGENETQIKENIKMKALNSYLIKICYDKYPIYGFHIEFDWYIDHLQLSFIKNELDNTNYDMMESKEFFLFKENILNKYCIKYFRMAKNNPKHSYYKMPDLSKALKILKYSHFEISVPFDPKVKVYLEEDAFSVFNELEELKIRAYWNTAFQLKKNCFDRLSKLKKLKLGLSYFEKSQNRVFDHLKNLKYLDIQISSFSTYTDIFYGLCNLVELNLEFNSVSHRLEDSVFDNLTNLENLSITSNVVNTRYFKNLSNLKELNLILTDNSKQLEDDMFTSLSKLNRLEIYSSKEKLNTLKSNLFNGLYNLKELCIKNYYFNEIEQGAFRFLINLERLDLDFSKLEILEDGNYLRNLKVIEITAEIDSQEQFEYVFSKINSIHLKNLKELFILFEDSQYHFNANKKYPFKIDGNLLYGLENLTNLEISVGFCRGLSIDVLSFEKMTNLEHLGLTRNGLSLTKKDNLLLTNLKNLKSLNLFYNNSFQVDSVFFKNLTNLIDLNLSCTDLITLNDKLFESLENLETLKISKKSFDDFGELFINESTFYGLKSLKKLKLKYLSISNLSGNMFINVPNLIELDLNRCEIRSIDSNSFNYVPKLEYLDLSNNLIEEMNTQQFSVLINLKKLNIYKNPFIYRRDIANFYNDLNISNLNLVIDEESLI